MFPLVNSSVPCFLLLNFFFFLFSVDFRFAFCHGHLYETRVRTTRMTSDLKSLFSRSVSLSVLFLGLCSQIASAGEAQVSDLGDANRFVFEGASSFSQT